MSRATASALFGLFALASACGGAQSSTESLDTEIDESGSQAGADVSIQVISHAFRDSNIFLFVGGSRQRLGIAYGNRTTVFTIPWSRFEHVNEVRLLADPIGQHGDVARTYFDIGSDRFTVKPGNTVVWTLEVHLGQHEGPEAQGQSNVMVY